MEKTEIYKQLNEANNSNSQLSDQNILLKAQLTAASDLAQQNGMHSNHVNNVENQMASMNIDYQTQISFYQSENSRLVAENHELKINFNEVHVRAEQNSAELEKLRKDQEDLLELLTDQVSTFFKMIFVTASAFNFLNSSSKRLDFIEAVVFRVFLGFLTKILVSHTSLTVSLSSTK